MAKLTHSKYFNGFKELLNPTDIYTAIKPLYCMSKISGLAPFCYRSVKSEVRIQTSVLGTIHSYVMCGVLMILLTLLCKWKLENEFPRFGLIIDIVGISDTCVSSVGVIVSYILCATTNRRKVERFLSLVHRVDACLIKTSDYYKTVCISIMVGILTLILMYSVMFVMLNLYSSDFIDITSYIYFLFHFLGMTTFFQFVYSVLLLKQRFATLNEDLLTVFDIENEHILDERQIVSKPELEGQTACEESWHQTSTIERFNRLDAKNRNLGYANELLDTEDRKRSVKITVLRRAHSILCDASELTNSMFQIPILAGFIEIFVEITVYLYATLTHVIDLLTCQSYNASRWSMLGMLFIWTAVNFSKLMAVTASCHSASQHANRSAAVVHKLLVVQSPQPETTAELELFSRQLLHRKCHFSACGFFPIDLTLLYSMAGSITTYIIILLQYTGQDVGNFFELCNTTFNKAV